MFDSAGLVVSETGTWSNSKVSPRGKSEQVAVTGACLAIPRDLFLRLGGFDEAYVGGGCEDVDLCLRSWHAGYRVLLEPESRILHREATTRAGLMPRSRDDAVRNQALLEERWGDIYPRMVKDLDGSKGESTVEPSASISHSRTGVLLRGKLPGPLAR